MNDVDFLSSGTQLIKTATEYGDTYSVLTNLGLPTHEVFMIAVYVGIRSGKKRTADSYGGKEFRTSYLNPKQKGVLYALAFKEGLLGKEEAAFRDPEVIKNVKLMFNEYANEGMAILSNKVFDEDFRNKGRQDNSEVVKRLMQYVLEETKATPF